MLRSPTLQKLGLWSYSIYMITFIFHVMKMSATFIAQKAKLDLVIWHNSEKLVLLGTPDRALLPALILSVVLVVPVAAVTYRWIEKPAMDLARHGFATGGPAPGFTRPARWLRSITARRAAPNRQSA